MLVIVYRASYDEKTFKYFLHLNVIGKSPLGESEVIDFLIEWARTSKPSRSATMNIRLDIWGYLFSKLSERKEYVGVIPYAFTCGESFEEALDSSNKYHAIFKDASSNSIYFIARDQHRCYSGSCSSYRIRGVEVENQARMIEIDVYFFATMDDYLRKHGPVEGEEELRSLAQSTQIYTRVWDSADPRVKELFDHALP